MAFSSASQGRIYQCFLESIVLIFSFGSFFLRFRPATPLFKELHSIKIKTAQLIILFIRKQIQRFLYLWKPSSIKRKLRTIGCG